MDLCVSHLRAECFYAACIAMVGDFTLSLWYTFFGGMESVEGMVWLG